jgi:hypothetical protein
MDLVLGGTRLKMGSDGSRRRELLATRLMNGDDSQERSEYPAVDRLDRLPLLAQSGHRSRATECPLSGVKRTSRGHDPMSAFDPKRTSAGLFSCDAVHSSRFKIVINSRGSRPITLIGGVGAVWPLAARAQLSAP